MLLSDVSVTRPVFAAVISLLLLVFGIVSFTRLPLREYPDIDPPIVSISVNYPGASASIVENRVTELVEDRISGIAGIKYIDSSSTDGQARITLEFDISRDIEGATNDVRDAISGILDNLPDEADPPEVRKVDSSDEVIIWLSLASQDMTVPQLTDYADRYIVDRFSVLDGVAQVRIGGAKVYALRIWLDRKELAARGLTVNDVEDALRSENVELPAGSIESSDLQFTIRLQRTFRTVSDFSKIVLKKANDGYLIRLGDVARIELGSQEDRTIYRGNGSPQVGIGIIKQSTANTIGVARAAKKEALELNKSLPKGMTIEEAYDTSVFIEQAIHEVYNTLFIALGLVAGVIFLFLRNLRATLIPVLAVPVSIMSTFIVLSMLGYSINLLTLLALVLAIGLVVDDAIVVIENIVRRMHEFGETPLVASYRGTRQVGFAVITTTMVLIAVFAPISFLQGDVGRLFSEFAIAMAAAVFFSGIVALTLTPMLSSKLLKGDIEGKDHNSDDSMFGKIRVKYRNLLGYLLRVPLITLAGFGGIIAIMVIMFLTVPKEYTPKEDRGAFSINVNGPEGASFAYMQQYMDEIERRLMPYVESGEVQRLIVRAPRSFGATSSFNTGAIICTLSDWGHRRSAWVIMDEVRAKLSDLPGVRAFPLMRQGFSGSTAKPVQFVIGGGTYEDLVKWRDILVAKINENNPGLTGIDWNYKETKPQIEVNIDYVGASELGVTVEDIGRTLQTVLGSRNVTTYIDQGKEYDVIVQGERDDTRTIGSLENLYVRSARTGSLIPLSNLVNIKETADSSTLSRYNRVRAITLEADLQDGYTLGEALNYLVKTTRANLPENVIIDYKGQSQDFKESGSSIYFVFALGVAVMFLVMAAQFESFVQPLVIIFTVPLAMAGALLGLWITGGSLNIFTQIGLIMLVGLAAKNGILIVEFTNQLRSEGKSLTEALSQASELRLRPILMTSITAAAGAVPLIISHGAGSETRAVVGVVIFAGVLAATFFTLFVVPVAYSLLARKSGSPGDVRRRLDEEMHDVPEESPSTHH